MTGPGRGVSGRALIGALALVVLAACGSSSSSSSLSGVKGGSEVKAQAINTSGTNPFTASVAKDHAGVKPPPGASSTSGGPVTYVASTPGLYGGTRNISVCDARKLVAFLQQNQSKAAAWAGVLGIQQSQISTYVDKLTPVLLRTDTRVTNHGYTNGSATTFQAVLQAGTAVLVDQYGRPTVKCYCGNPLTPPVPESSPTYTGSLWPGFSTTSITIIQQSTTIINQYILYDPNTGRLYPQSPGIDGKAGPYQGGTTTAKPPSTSQGTSGQRQENPSVSLSPNPVTVGGTVTLSATGFAPNVDLAIDVNRPDGNTDHFSTPTDGSGNASYTFPNAGGSQTGTYTVTVSNPNTGARASTTIQVVPSSGGNTGGGGNTGNTGGGGNTGQNTGSGGNTGGGNTGSGNTTPGNTGSTGNTGGQTTP
jgi:hypothetical protein